MNPDTSLITFKSISNFTSELGELFSKRQRPLKLYCRLINKTTITHNKSIEKHIDAFRRFCTVNRTGIIKKDSSKFSQNKILYSQRVYIDMGDIFRYADKDTTKIIWQHLLCISALVDPEGKAKEVLKQNRQAKARNPSNNPLAVLGGDGASLEGKEGDFLTNIINKVQENVDPNSTNPMEAIGKILQSGVVGDLLGGMNNGLSDGSLDIGKLMGAVQGMIGSMGGAEGGDPQTAQMMNMMTSMMGNFAGIPPPNGEPMRGPPSEFSPPSASTTTSTTINETSDEGSGETNSETITTTNTAQIVENQDTHVKTEIQTETHQTIKVSDSLPVLEEVE